ncbi:MAG: TonB-dependent receptor plug domain-containing protein, partial [Gammaproteobacteria bacterium]|nr:TonB-dependent receptor plug domain-containing protein [Gammaproteobacteria bacterium]
MRLVVFVLCLLSGYAAASSVGVISGESLRKSLDRFSIHGINIVSTSWSVPRRLKVADVPPSHLQVRAQAEWLLAQHGLRLVMVDLRNGFVSKAQIPTFKQEELQIPERNAPKEIEEMVVFARYQLSNKTRLSQRLDKQDFDSMPSIGRDTLRSLQNLPGIGSSGISARHRFRGGDGNEVLYLLDDLELVAPFHFEGFHELFSTLNPNIIQSGDVYVGGYPVKYGSKMSGVVNLDLIEPSHVLGGTLDLNLYAGSVNVTGYKGNWDWLFSARQSVLNQGLQQIETDYGRAKFHDELVRVSWQSSQDEHVLGMLNTEDKINLRDERGGEFGTADVKYQAAWWKWSRDLRGNANMEWRLSWTAADISRRGIRLNGDVTEGQLFESRDFDLFRLQNDWGWTLSPSWEVLLGWSYAFHNGQFIADLTSTYAPIYQPIQGALTRQRNLDSKRSGTSSYLFISSTNTFGKLSVTSGIRLDGQDIDPVHVNQISARSSLNYEIDDSLNLFLNIGRYTQQQQLRELQIDDGKLELDLPQHSDQANLGLQWVGDTWSLRVEGYY